MHEFCVLTTAPVCFLCLGCLQVYPHITVGGSSAVYPEHTHSMIWRMLCGRKWWKGSKLSMSKFSLFSQKLVKNFFWKAFGKWPKHSVHSCFSRSVEDMDLVSRDPREGPGGTLAHYMTSELLWFSVSCGYRWRTTPRRAAGAHFHLSANQTVCAS